MKELSSILNLLHQPDCASFKNIAIQSISQDSRTVRPGTLFCAVKGGKNDGHDFIQFAIEKGAVAILCEEKQVLITDIPIIVIPNLYHQLGKLGHFFYDEPSKKIKVIGVTGTNGKTSTAHYVAQYLHLLGKKVAIMGTVGNGLWGHLSPSTHTTPDVFSIHQALSEYVKAGAEYASMEVSSHALTQNRVDEVQFYVAIFTNISHEHLDYHGDMQHYSAAKATLFKKTSLKYAIINRDDPHSGEMIKSLNPHTRCFLYSQIHHDDAAHFVFASNIEHIENNTRFQFYSPWGHFPVTTHLLGEFNIANLLASITTVSTMGFDTETLTRLTTFIQPVMGRMETLRHPKLPLIVIDFAHTPDALKKALQSLQLYDKTIWLVFGCGGDRDCRKRPEMAKIAEFYAEHVIVTEDNSRFEDLHQIFSDIRAGFHHPKNVHFIEHRTDAIRYALKNAKHDDIILLAGKGHETYLDKKGQKIRYDEREVVMDFAA